VKKVRCQKKLAKSGGKDSPDFRGEEGGKMIAPGPAVPRDVAGRKRPAREKRQGGSSHTRKGGNPILRVFPFESQRARKGKTILLRDKTQGQRQEKKNAPGGSSQRRKYRDRRFCGIIYVGLEESRSSSAAKT